MHGTQKLETQVDESPGDLDESLVELGQRPGGVQPEMLEHVVGLVVFARVEMGKEKFVAGGEFPRPSGEN